MKKKVAFICVHNSCRSQMAEDIGNHLYGDYLECYSAGTELKDQINQDAVRIVKELYGMSCVSCDSSIKESYFNNGSAAETIQQRVMSELLPQERRAILQSNQISKAVQSEIKVIAGMNAKM